MINIVNIIDNIDNYFSPFKSSIFKACFINFYFEHHDDQLTRGPQVH